MPDKEKITDKGKKFSEYFRPLDLVIIVLFLLIAVIGIDMFRYDFLRTINLKNIEPVGTVVIKKNTVQRRISDRVLWDRLANESPVYLGDIIRVANVSAATLIIEDNSIDLDENTLIRINHSSDGKGLQLVLNEGTLSIATGAEGTNISLDLKGRQVQVAPDTVLSAIVNDSGGISLQVSEGNAQIVAENGMVREITSGNAINVNADGTALSTRTVVVTQPAPNARYVKSTKEPLPVNFSWNRINLGSEEKLRMEISSDRNFSRIINVIENLDTQAQAQFDAGSWYWRLLYDDAVLSAGRLTIADGSGPELQNPVFNSLISYSDKVPVINFQWMETLEANSYIFEISSTADFSNTQIRRQSSSASITISSLREGTWYWRVRPVFPSAFNGISNFSTASFFRIEKISSVSTETANEVSLSQWLTSLASSKELPSDLPPEIIPPRFSISPEPPANLPPPSSSTPTTQPSTVSPLSSPRNLQPAIGTVFDLQYFRAQRSIDFSWTAVQGANAYTFLLYQQTGTTRRQIVRQTIYRGTSYTLTNLSLLDRGNFIWQVEALNMRGSVTERRSTAAESSFIIDFPFSSPLQMKETESINEN